MYAKPREVSRLGRSSSEYFSFLVHGITDVVGMLQLDVGCTVPANICVPQGCLDRMVGRTGTGLSLRTPCNWQRWQRRQRRQRLLVQDHSFPAVVRRRAFFVQLARYIIALEAGAFVRDGIFLLGVNIY